MKKTALVNIDFINDLVHEDGLLSSQFSHNLKESDTIGKANEVIRFARKHNLLNIYIKLGFSDDYREISPSNAFFGRAVKLGALKLGKWGTEFHKDLLYDPKDPVVIKHRISIFYSTNFECLLRKNSIERLIITGVATDLAVQMLAKEAIDRDMEVIVCKDACATYCDELHNNTLLCLERLAKVVSNDELTTDMLLK